MKRKALLKDGDKFVVLEESEFKAETALQEALKRNPEVIPVGDLELAPVVVVGRETRVAAGAIDLLLVDAHGQVIILETKLSRNPELRRQAVAQILDYGASLWQKAPSLREFETLALRYWHSEACEDTRVRGAKSLREGVDPIFKELRSEDWDYESFETNLAENLAKGQHVLLLVATGLMDTLSRHLLQYANICLKLALYGVAIDVFETEDRQLIVPRGVRYAPQPERTDGPTTPREFSGACTPVAAIFFQEMVKEAKRRGMIIFWGSKGFSVRMPFEPPVTVMYGYPPDDFRVYTGQWGLDDEGRTRFHEQLQEEWGFSPSGHYTNILHVSEKTHKNAYAAVGFMWGEVDKMMAGARGEDEPGERLS